MIYPQPGEVPGPGQVHPKSYTSHTQVIPRTAKPIILEETHGSDPHSDPANLEETRVSDPTTGSLSSLKLTTQEPLRATAHAGEL